MRKSPKLLAIIVLIIVVFSLSACKSNDNSNKEYALIKKKILEKLNITDKKLIKDIVNAGNSYYFIYEPKMLDKKLYKYEEEQEPKLLFEFSNMKLYGNDEFLYVHYSDYENYHSYNNILYIEDDRVENLGNIGSGRIVFSYSNKCFAILGDTFSQGFFIGKKSQGYCRFNMDFGKNPNPYVPIRVKRTVDFSYDDTKFFIIYSINWGQDEFLEFDLTSDDTIFDQLGNGHTFQRNGFYDDENYKFNPNTGDVLYVSGLIDSKGNQVKNNSKDKYLYLRNIYTNNMYMIGKISANKIDKYTYDFNEDNQIVINGKTLIRDIKVKKNLVYTESKTNQ